jgi:tetratricopeptide (TPR) repeat protein
MIRATWLSVLLLALPVAAAEPVATPAPAAPVPAKGLDEAAQLQELLRAQRLIADKQVDAGLAALDAMIARYEATYPAGKTRWYVARDSGESLAYLIHAATEMDKGTVAEGTVEARPVISQWANAWYLKGYALIELKRLDEARAALDQAIRLSPFNSMFITERAEVAKLERKWDLAMADYVLAADVATFSGDDAARDKAQALRGQAFVHVELGDLDAAEKILKAVLKADPGDQKARNELEYIEQARAATQQVTAPGADPPSPATRPPRR